VQRVYEIKARSATNPLPLFVSGLSMAAEVAEVSAAAELLAEWFWPGALTIVMPVRAGFTSVALAGGDSVALRAPDHPLALMLIEGFGRPVTATSANISGGPDPVSASEVRRQLGHTVDFVLDAGDCPVGVASTIVDCTSPTISILRHGAISEATILAALAGI
jgi:L-threonylcarbamoyladenylate synthase